MGLFRKSRKKRINYLCHACADKLGWRWPEVHRASAHTGVCDVCHETKMLTCENDWLKGKQTELKEWD